MTTRSAVTATLCLIKLQNIYDTIIHTLYMYIHSNTICMTGDYCYISKCNPLIISYNHEHVVLIASMFHAGGEQREGGGGGKGKNEHTVGM